MFSTVLVSTVAGSTVSAQTAAAKFEKAPPNVSDALQARAKEFYQDHVDGKYRKAEALVAGDSKEGYYASTKPALLSYTISDISYSEKYTKAKVTVVGKMMMTFLGVAGPQLMDVPFPSYWKLEHGKWVWYVYRDPNRITPFGKENAKAVPANGADPAQAFASAPNLEMILNGVKADKKAVGLGKTPGVKDTVTLMNQLAGNVTLSFEQEKYDGLAVKLEPKVLKQGEKAVLTIETAPAKEYINRVVRVMVQPSNQMIDVMVRFQ